MGSKGSGKIEIRQTKSDQSVCVFSGNFVSVFKKKS